MPLPELQALQRLQDYMLKVLQHRDGLNSMLANNQGISSPYSDRGLPPSSLERNHMVPRRFTRVRAWRLQKAKYHIPNLFHPQQLQLSGLPEYHQMAWSKISKGCG